MLSKPMTLRLLKLLSNRRSALLADTMTRRMRSGVTPKGGSGLTKLALAMREPFLVGERVEGI